MSGMAVRSAFDLEDLAALRAALRDQRLPPPPVFEHPGSVRDAIRFFGLAPELPSLPRPGEPVEPLAELDAYFREDCEARLMHGHPARLPLEFGADEILFANWKWGADFRLSVAREAAVAAFRQLIQRKVDTLLLTEEAGDAARDAAPAGSDVDIRQLSLPAMQHKLVGNEIDDEALVGEILQLMAGGKSRAEAISQVYLRALRMKPATSDKQVRDRLRGKVARRQRGA